MIPAFGVATALLLVFVVLLAISGVQMWLNGRDADEHGEFHRARRDRAWGRAFITLAVLGALLALPRALYITLGGE